MGMEKKEEIEDEELDGKWEEYKEQEFEFQKFLESG
jgi:hypothetical protein